MQRTDINPWEWSKTVGFSQAVDVTGTSRVMLCSGQTATGDDGLPPSSSDMAKQVEQALANLTRVLGAGGMTIADVVKLTLYTTDVEDFLAAYAPASALFDGNLPAMTLIGVTRLAFPELKLEIEAIAAK